MLIIEDQKSAGLYINSWIDSDRNLYLIVNSLKEIHNIITGANNITLRKVNVKPYRFVDQFNERRITPIKFYSILLNRMHPSYDENGHLRYCFLMRMK